MYCVCFNVVWYIFISCARLTVIYSFNTRLGNVGIFADYSKYTIKQMAVDRARFCVGLCVWCLGHMCSLDLSPSYFWNWYQPGWFVGGALRIDRLFQSIARIQTVHNPNSLPNECLWNAYSYAHHRTTIYRMPSQSQLCAANLPVHAVVVDDLGCSVAHTIAYLG